MANDEVAEKELFDTLEKGGDSARAVFLKGATIFYDSQGRQGLDQWIKSAFFRMPIDDQAVMLGVFLEPYLESKKNTKH